MFAEDGLVEKNEYIHYVTAVTISTTYIYYL